MWLGKPTRSFPGYCPASLKICQLETRLLYSHLGQFSNNCSVLLISGLWHTDCLHDSRPSVFDLCLQFTISLDHFKNVLFSYVWLNIFQCSGCYKEQLEEYVYCHRVLQWHGKLDHSGLFRIPLLPQHARVPFWYTKMFFEIWKHDARQQSSGFECQPANCRYRVLYDKQPIWVSDIITKNRL